jgi:Gram-negative bacterial TonB protein C-terminal
MLSLKLAANSRRLALAPTPALKKLVKPPALKLLPRSTYTKGLLLSGGFHVVMIVALIWLPILFPSPVVIDAYDRKEVELASADEPLILPSLPQITASSSGSMGSAETAAAAHSSAAAESIPLKRDYAGPQEIISGFPHATNRVQTIRRPDLVAPPELKFPLRLQSVVILPAAAAPRYSIRRTEVQVPIPEATVALPKLVSVPEPVSTVPAEPAPSAATVQPTAVSSPVVELQAAPRKAIIVVNAVTVAPDPAVQIPDAQLSGNFVVGPSRGAVALEKSSASGDGGSAETAATNNSTAVSQPYKGSSAGSDISNGSLAGGSHSAGSGSGNIAGIGTGIAPIAGPGSGSGVATRGNSNSGATGRGAAGSSGAVGISMSGGSSGRNGGLGSRSVPMSRSYGITIISGGSSGGAGRDMGVFDRSETVFSVAIPMGDAGGGPDWPMQYSMLNHGEPGSGLLVPPFAQKKVAAAVPRNQLAGEQGPVFISGVIDETGKLQSLRTVRVQDARSQPAIQALQQWQFLPAQLDGRPVASKVLIGVNVIGE